MATFHVQADDGQPLGRFQRALQVLDDEVERLERYYNLSHDRMEVEVLGGQIRVLKVVREALNAESN